MQTDELAMASNKRMLQERNFLYPLHDCSWIFVRLDGPLALCLTFVEIQLVSKFHLDMHKFVYMVYSEFKNLNFVFFCGLLTEGRKIDYRLTEI